MALAAVAGRRAPIRSGPPADEELRREARIEREDGRKRYLSGRLMHGDTLCSDAEGLFLQLLPGQR